MRKCFQNQFWTSGSAPIGKRMKVKLHVFWLGHMARSKIEFESSFPIKYYIITIFKKIGVFRLIFNNVKKWISHCIFKSCVEWFKGFFSS